MKTRLLLPAGITFLALACNPALSAPGKGDPQMQVRNPDLTVEWSGAETRPAAFSKVMLAPVQMQFREVAPLTGPTGYSGNRTDFPVPAEQQRELSGTFNRIFAEELAKSSNFRLVTEAGEGVLLLRPSLRDIVSRVPPEEPVGRSYVYTDSVGEATLVVEFVDGASGQVLGSAKDRRTAEPAAKINDFGAVRANQVATGQEVRRLARRWGRNLHNRVEQLYQDALPE